MRILTYGLLYNRLSGQDTFLFNMNRNMERCSFDYFVLGDYCLHEERIKKDGGKLYLVRNYWKNPIGYIADNYRILKENRSSHDICYFNLFSMVHLTPIVLARLLNYKIVMHSHNSSLERYWTLHRINRFLFGGMKKCTRLACSKKAAEFMYGKGQGRAATIINNAIEVEKFRFSNDAREKLKRELNIEGKTVFGFVGRLDPQKNPIFLIDIFSEIAKLNDDAMFVIVGDGGMRKEVEAKIKEYCLEDKILLLGIREDVNLLYSIMDVFILPSLYEGLPIVLVETQAAGLVSIVSEEAVPKETRVEDNYIIYKSINLSAAEWARDAINACDKSRDRLEWNDRLAKSQFEIKNEAKRLEEIFLNL